MADVYLSLGSNLEPEKNIRLALGELFRNPGVIGLSTVYRTSPIKSVEQPDFYNCVARCETSVGPHELKFTILREIEARLGRKRVANRYAPRTIDIDLIIYGEECFDERGLHIPDPDIRHRPFLAFCLQELNDRLSVPCAHLNIWEITTTISRKGMKPLDRYTTELREEFKLH
ncbi:MAG: 2-amino-4-hydroxy-6-hydroxymethyldihydropteridine diphosphokinase [Thermoplasmata archaeon]|nr:2-amino-4-hydroxy-6-hydroxymethyldihydropteridine diphosphokinase [Candidatus Sysuiplasma acidicola]MBX8645772.1 2-amino-4-hydroxy-6-hydroxymethyldihydropteridine diphosphokinase [Candidatus Sysuiplasma acidicola]MDH2905885.1 2-amino-4-hydroxy-6-hydroxymethyldihydropteridine diphosphokinase [Methanomassiliicoccales archaeon]